MTDSRLRPGSLFVVTAPSGAGKTSLVHALLADAPLMQLSVSFTTRPPRPGEVDGRDYFFVGEERFARMVREGRFAEWARVHGHRYGTSWREIRAKSAGGRTLVLDVDVQGARSIKRQFPEAVGVFVVPPTLAALKRRLRRRQQRIDPEARRRLAAALKELRAYRRYDYLLVNDDLEAALAQLRCLLVALRLETARAGGHVAKLLRGAT